MPLSTHLKWYETSENLDGLRVVPYSRAAASDTVVSVGVGGLLVNWEDTCEKWHTKWDKTENGRFEFHFERQDHVTLSEPLKLTLPVLKITDRWFKANGRVFDPMRTMGNRVNQLTRFLGDKGILIPGGTLFIVTRPGVKASLADSKSYSLVLGYSTVEPEPEFHCTPMHYSDIPDLWVPKSLGVISEPRPPRVSRYERPWVI